MISTYDVLRFQAAHAKLAEMKGREVSMEVEENAREVNTPDIEVLQGRGGSLYVVSPKTQEGREWLEENVSQEGYQPDFPRKVYVEHRYIGDLVWGMEQAGLVIRREEE